VETDRLARELARETGESLTEAVNTALKERLHKVGAKGKTDRDKFLAEIRKIQAMVSPKLRNAKKTGREMIDEMYDENGLPK
jgi:antitoxin VapB